MTYACERVCQYACDVGMPEYSGITDGKTCGNCAHYAPLLRIRAKVWKGWLSHQWHYLLRGPDLPNGRFIPRDNQHATLRHAYDAACAELRKRGES